MKKIIFSMLILVLSSCGKDKDQPASNIGGSPAQQSSAEDLVLTEQGSADQSNRFATDGDAADLEKSYTFSVDLPSSLNVKQYSLTHIGCEGFKPRFAIKFVLDDVEWLFDRSVAVGAHKVLVRIANPDRCKNLVLDFVVSRTIR
jgi:hypothetical protein